MGQAAAVLDKPVLDKPVLANPKAQRVRSVAALARRSVRARTGLFLVEGPQPVREAVAHRPAWVRDVYLSEVAAGRHPDIVDAVRGAQGAGHQVRLHTVTDAVLGAMCDAESPQGLLAVCRVPSYSLDAGLAGEPRLVCVLADVRDPGNAGTVLRAADAAGADLVVLAGSSVDVFGPKAVRSSAGSLFHVPVVTGIPAEEAVTTLRDAGLRVLAADAHASATLDEADLDRAHAWVFGNEAWGLPDSVLGLCDAAIRVPIYGSAESLNLAMAATVCLYASAAALQGRGG